MVAGKLNASWDRLKDGLKGFPGAGLLTRWLRGEQGSASLEFALVGLLLITMTIGVIEVAAVMIVNVLVEGGLREASRAGITGFVPAGQTREQVILARLSTHTQGLVTPATATIETRVYPSFANVGQPEPFDDDNGNGTRDAGESYSDLNGNGTWDADMGEAGLGGPGDIVHYRVSYDWHLLTGLLMPALSSTGIIRLSASVVVRNEPY